MTIIDNEPWISELLTKFKVLSVRYNFESMWRIQYENSEPFIASDQCYGTIEADEQLVGKEIRAQIYLSVEEILPTIKKEKNLIYKDGWITVTGIYKDIIISTYTDEAHTSYKLDSVFPLEIGEIPDGAKIGDWITVSGEAVINIPRKRNLVTNLLEPEIINLE